jgi:hypothetical protein
VRGDGLVYGCLSYQWTAWKEDEEIKKILSLPQQPWRYVWVDRWCLNQQSEKYKMKQIPRMAEYYGSAEGILILPSSELPPPPYELARGCVIVDSKDESLVSVATSWHNDGWYTRVWTLQEGMLAKAALVYAAGTRKLSDLKECLACSEATRSQTQKAVLVNSV